jgi:hypothetical protein
LPSAALSPSHLSGCVFCLCCAFVLVPMNCLF